jgi:transposase InsO family protein
VVTTIFAGSETVVVGVNLFDTLLFSPISRIADITYLPTAAGWVYLAVVLDLFSRKVCGLSDPRKPRHAAGQYGSS